MRESPLLDRERVLKLLESYEPLLTEKQKEAIDGYYRYDLSLSEISEEKGTSRAAVNDTLKKTIAKLEDYERKLRFVEKKKQWKAKAEAIALLPKEEQAEQYRALNEEITHGI